MAAAQEAALAIHAVHSARAPVSRSCCPLESAASQTYMSRNMAQLTKRHQQAALHDLLSSPSQLPGQGCIICPHPSPRTDYGPPVHLASQSVLLPCGGTANPAIQLDTCDARYQSVMDYRQPRCEHFVVLSVGHVGCLLPFRCLCIGCCQLHGSQHVALAHCRSVDMQERLQLALQHTVAALSTSIKPEYPRQRPVSGSEHAAVQAHAAEQARDPAFPARREHDWSGLSRSGMPPRPAARLLACQTSRPLPVADVCLQHCSHGGTSTGPSSCKYISEQTAAGVRRRKGQKQGKVLVAKDDVSARVEHAGGRVPPRSLPSSLAALMSPPSPVLAVSAECDASMTGMTRPTPKTKALQNILDSEALVSP
jgi:hypothetical protein